MKLCLVSILACLSTVLVSNGCSTARQADGNITQQLPAHPGILKEKLVSYLTGDSSDITTNAEPGLLLAGGSTDLDSAVKWFLDRSNGGDVVVLRATESDGYNQYMFDLSKVNSVETLVIDTLSKAWLPEVAWKIRHAEALFISGGDQWNYVRFWKDSPVEDAINYLLNTKKVPVGGTSAGLAILGAAYFSAKNGTVTSAQALSNPYDSLNAIGHGDFLQAPFMNDIITDSHYTQRDRHGRHITWMARLLQDTGFTTVRGIGIDEKTALCIDENGH
jgi:cyanophycinase-like exopeptidase